MVASEASSWQSATTLRTACPGIDRGRSNLLMSAFVSTTTRALVFLDKGFGQLFLGHPSRGSALADAVTEALELVRVERA
jgi:D-serine deaminase-like pyridoxal phosphate-dependent protein